MLKTLLIRISHRTGRLAALCRRVRRHPAGQERPRHLERHRAPAAMVRLLFGVDIGLTGIPARIPARSLPLRPQSRIPPDGGPSC